MLICVSVLLRVPPFLLTCSFMMLLVGGYPCRVWISTSRRVVRLDCIQLLHDMTDTPLLPPDCIHMSPDISFDGTPRSTSFRDAAKAREEYQRLRKAKA